VRWGWGTQSSDLLEVDKKFFDRFWRDFTKPSPGLRARSAGNPYALWLRRGEREFGSTLPCRYLLDITCIMGVEPKRGADERRRADASGQAVLAQMKR
jgi:hypothetical protein